ncbi:hypothetical protein GQ473_07360 [archaeon]|nr:hypothetical protein [archaeon]
MVDYKKHWFERLIIMGIFLIIIGSAMIYLWSVIQSGYVNNYDMYSNKELTCLDLGVETVFINNESYTCSQILNACNINISFTNNTLDIEYDTVPFCNGIFWGGL